jgi:ferredoxin
MRVSVDKKLCELHGVCTILAPEVFEFDDDGQLVWDPDPADNTRDDVESAAASCPVQAILWEDD